MKKKRNMSLAILSRNALAIACVLALGVTGSVSAMGSTPMFDAALEDQPCEIVTAAMVAKALDIPESSIEQSNVVASRCSYKLEAEVDKVLIVEVAIDVYETDESAAEVFYNATRSISSDKIAGTMAALTDSAEYSNAQQDAAEGMVSGLFQNGIQFEDVDGLADQARFDTGDGTLQLLQDNVRIKLRAFYGPSMPLPDKITSETIMKTLNNWMQDTMSQRREHAVKLANIVLEAL